MTGTASIGLVSSEHLLCRRRFFVQSTTIDRHSHGGGVAPVLFSSLEPLSGGLDFPTITLPGYCRSIQVIVLAARRSSVCMARAICSSLVSSILLWLIPRKDWTNNITVGIPA
jgi:hypothetical protein